LQSSYTKVVNLRFSLRRTACLLAATAVALGGPATGASAAGEFNVKDYGATGNGSSNDTSAINNAITAANNAGGGTVRFPSGTYKSSNSIHMKSNVTVQLDSGATIVGASGTGYDKPEDNPNDEFQDYGHSHFHNAMIWGDRLTNIAFVGSGTIDGGDHLITGNPDSGQADKIISLTRCDGLTVSGITLRRGGHFAMLINDCTNVTSDQLTIDTAGDRDGWNVISTTNVKITNANIAANDDALVFKSDYALGAKLSNGNVTVSDSKLSAKCCNALMFGSETCGDFTHYQFDRITITGAQKSGLGLVSMDGSKISDVHYRDITVTGVRSPIMQKVGTRKRCGNNPGVGSISNITYDNITITGTTPSFSPTLWGESSGHISDVTFNNVNIRVPGGNGTMGTGVPSNDAGDYNPKSIGTRPAYGWYIRYANNIKFLNSSVRFASDDGRPAVIANNSGPLTFDNFVAQRGSNSPADFVFQSTTGVCASNVRDTNDNPVRYDPSTPPTCTPSSDFSLAASPTSQTVPAGSSATYNVHTATVSGTPGPITLSATGQPAGSQVTFSPNPVTPGSDSTTTVTTSAGAPNGTSSITVTGTSDGTVRTVPVGLTTTGGSDQLAITGLSVADSSNAGDWSVQQNLATGSTQYGDRTITFKTVPTALSGAQWIRTANDSKAATNNPLATFTVNRPATVSVAVDSRIGRPSWLADWTDTGQSLVNSEGTARTFHVFAKSFPAGQVALGANGSSSSSMYTVIVQ
jgi:polygalacturonase